MNETMKRFIINTLKTLVLPLLVIAIFAVITNGRTLNTRMLMVTLRQSIIPIIISMALIGNMTLGMWDFSAGGVVIAASIIGANLMKLTNTGIPGLVIFCMLSAVLLTTLTGFLNNKLRVPTIVLTIGLVFVYEALPRIIFHGGATIRAKYTKLALEPYVFIILAIMFIVFYLLFNKSTYGHNLRALGGSQEIAKAAGINGPKILQKGFIYSGIFLGVASVLYMSNNGQINNVAPLTSVAIIFDAMMGVFLASFLSRFCNMAVGLVVGTFTMVTLTNGFVAMGLPATIRDITTGIFLLALLAISANQGRIKKWRMDLARAKAANAKYAEQTNSATV